MPKKAPLLSSPDEVEYQFYDALNHADLSALMACWADDDEVTCVPPGGEMLRGLAAIQALFAELFLRGPVAVSIDQVHKASGLSHAVHTLVEGVNVTTDEGQATADVIATNVYVKTMDGWRLQAHHASPGRLRVVDPAASTEIRHHTLH